MSKYLSGRFVGMAAYVPGEQPQDRSYIKLNTNESPFPPSPAVLAALSESEARMLNLYPDPDAREACETIAARFGLQPGNVILGNGSDELLAFCFQAYCDALTPAVYADITYGFYSVFARVNCIDSVVLPLDDSFQVNASDYFDAPGAVFIANPNSPTGCALAADEIEEIVSHNPNNAVIIDEAYEAFGAQSAIPLIKRYNNLIVIQTMSKSKNLAGARLAYALADSGLIGDLQSMRCSFNPYNVNRLSLLAATAAIKDADYYDACVEKIIKTREHTVLELRDRGFFVLPSKTNFIFAKPGFISGGAYYGGLKERGVLVRHFRQRRVDGFVRITIGDDSQMRALLSATDDMMKIKMQNGN